jgi:hypothetical protein
VFVSGFFITGNLDGSTFFEEDHLNWPREQEDFSFQDDLGVIKAQRVAVLVGRLPPLRRPLHWFECVRVLKEGPPP